LENKRNILNFYDENIILSYIDNRLNDEDKSQFEAQLETDEMLRDAVEGLCKINNIQTVKRLQSSIDATINLHTQTKLRRKKGTHNLSSLWLSITIVIALIILSIGYILYFR
jgi:anti-sigma factor RsiW